QTTTVEAPALLTELLSEVEQRSFGLPQLLESSDQLSEVYIRIVERDLVRRGLLIWRYNDDFRIAVKPYGDALEAIERLAASAREIGLTLNDHKTRTPGLFNYLFSHTNLQIDDKSAKIDPNDVELIVTDYLADDEEQEVDIALSTLARLQMG